MKRLAKLVVTLVTMSALVAFVVLMGSLIYPGSMKWTSSWVCPEDKQDTVVVRDTYQTEPGETSTNFTLYCLGPRGETENAGFGKPLGVLIIAGVALVGAIIVFFFIIGTLRRLLRTLRGGGSGGGRDDDDDDMIGLVPDETDSAGEVAPPLTDYGGQPPLIS